MLWERGENRLGLKRTSGVYERRWSPQPFGEHSVISQAPAAILDVAYCYRPLQLKTQLHQNFLTILLLKYFWMLAKMGGLFCKIYIYVLIFSVNNRITNNRKLEAEGVILTSEALCARTERRAVFVQAKSMFTINYLRRFWEIARLERL